MSGPVDPTTPSLSNFERVQGEPFTLQADGIDPLSATLVDVRPVGAAAQSGRQPFSLLFRGPPTPVLPQRIYRLAHHQLPALDLFLVPVAADSSGVRYEAIFN